MNEESIFHIVPRSIVELIITKADFLLSETTGKEHPVCFYFVNDINQIYGTW